MIFMPLSIIIDAPPSVVFGILDDSEKNSEWNPVTDEVKITDKNVSMVDCTVKSFMGDFTTHKDTVPDREVTLTITGNPVLAELKYELVPLPNNQTRVDGTIKLSGTAHYTTMHKSVGRALLDNLKRYIESGQPANFEKEC